MTGSRVSHRVIFLLLVAAIKNVESTSPARLRRKLGTGTAAKSTKSLSMKLYSAIEENPWGAQIHEFLWVEEEHTSMSAPYALLSISDTVMSEDMQPELSWHELEDELSISMAGDDYSVSISKEDAFAWDIFEMEETAIESEYTATPSDEVVEEVSLPITVETTHAPSSGSIQTSSPTVSFEYVTIAKCHVKS